MVVKIIDLAINQPRVLTQGVIKTASCLEGWLRIHSEEEYGAQLVSALHKVGTASVTVALPRFPCEGWGAVIYIDSEKWRGEGSPTVP